MTVVEENLVNGLALIFSGQLAIGIAEEQTSLLNEAEIKALQVQINPHFFFNAINTIGALMRVDVDKAHEALMQLSAFFRSSLQNGQEKEITLEQEKKHVDAYMSIEKIRFPNKFELVYDVSVPNNTLLPSFCLQIFVENAVRHAFGNKKKDNKIALQIQQVDDNYFEIIAQDNGNGVDPKVLEMVGEKPITESKGSGTALFNLNQRLQGLYGTKSKLQIKTGSEGTIFKTVIPLNFQEGATE